MLARHTFVGLQLPLSELLIIVRQPQKPLYRCYWRSHCLTSITHMASSRPSVDFSPMFALAYLARLSRLLSLVLLGI
jgi:hypothetical protein